MNQHICKIFVSITLLVAVASPIFAMGPTKTISADQFGTADFHRFTDGRTQIFFATEAGKIGGFGNGYIHMWVFPGEVGTNGGAFEGLVQITKNVTRRGNSEGLEGTISNGSAISNGFTIVYFATVTITGGTGRYEGATGTINLTATQSGIFDPTQPFPGPPNIPAEIILDGQYIVP